MSELKKLPDWITDQIQQHEFGTIEIIIKIKAGKPVYINRGFSEGLNLDARSTGEQHATGSTNRH